MLGINLLDYETSDHRSIKGALDFLAPFAVGVKKWPYQQIHPYEPRKAYRLFKFAQRFYTGNALAPLIETIPEKTRRKDLANIIF